VPLALAAASTGAAAATDGEGTMQDTLIGRAGPITSGGYGATVVKTGAIAGSNTFLTGAQGGWVINHRLVLGAGGYGLARDVRAPHDPEHRDLSMGYGGVRLEFTPLAERLVHLSTAILVGAGGLTIDDKESGGEGDASASFNVVEPEIGAEINVAEWFRIGIGATYRYFASVGIKDLDDRDVSGASGMLALKFGAF
jgi:hypothetical protein